MRTIGFIQRQENIDWGGDVTVTSFLKEGFESLGYRSIIADSIPKLPTRADFIFFFNIFQPPGKDPQLLNHAHIPYGYIALHLDFPKYRSAETGFFYFFFYLINKKKFHDRLLQLNDILDSPKWIFLFSKNPPMEIFNLFEDIEKASLIIANSQTEKELIEASYPIKCKTIATHWNIPKFNKKNTNDTPFLNRIGLKKGEYFLQIGRCSTRKNQLGSILALRNHQAPLVLISMSTSSSITLYTQICIAVCNLYRKGPTYLVTCDEKVQSQGNVKVFHTTEKLSTEEIADAYENAYMFIQPAFYECPGFTYLEALQANIPVVASSWSTLEDYLICDQYKDKYLEGRISYCTPYDIKSIERAIEKQESLSQKRAPFTHPILDRTPADLARDIAPEIERLTP